MSWDLILSLFARDQGTFVSVRPATSIWGAPIVDVLVMTSRPSRIPMPFTFWKAYLIQLSALLMNWSPVVSVAPLLGSEIEARLMPKQSSKESCFFTFRLRCNRSFFFLGLVDIGDLHCGLDFFVRARRGGMKDRHITELALVEF